MTYNELKQAVQDYLETDEATFLANFASFVKAVENRIYHTVQLPANRKDMTGTCEVGNKYLGTPEDFLSVFSLAVFDPTIGDYSYLMLKDVSLIHEIYPNPSLRGIPRYFGQFDKDTFIFGPTPDKQYVVELHYHYIPESLTTATAGTWLSSNFPSVLLYGVIAEGYRFQKGDAAQQKSYDDQYIQALGLLKSYGEVRVRTDAYANKPNKPETNVGE